MKITALPAEAAVALADLIAIVENATTTTKKATVAQLRIRLFPAVLTADVSGVLPVANGGTHQSALGSALQVLRTNAGMTDTEWATAATITGSAGQVVTSDGAGNGAGQTNVKAGSGFISIGATVPASGSLRLGNATASIIAASDGAGGKVVIAAVDNGANLVIGADDAGSPFQINDTYIYSGNRIILAPTGATRMRLNSGSTENAKPIIGLSSPYSVHGKIKVTLSGNHTMGSTEYIYNSWEFNGTLAAAPTITVPSAVDGAAYYVEVFLNWTDTSSATNATFTTGAGHTVTGVSNFGTFGGNGSKARLEVNGDGVYLADAAFNPT